MTTTSNTSTDTYPQAGGLAPCPHCGGAALLDELTDDTGETCFVVGCQECGAKIGNDLHERTAHEVTAAWNRRTPRQSLTPGGLVDDRLAMICAVLRTCAAELRSVGSGPADDLAHAIDDLLDGWQGTQP